MYPKSQLKIILMKRNISLYLLLLTALVMAFITGCSNKPETSSQRPPAPVTIAKALKKYTPYYLTAIGTVQPVDSITVRSRITGYLSKVYISNGDIVEKGEHLFTIDPTEYEAGIRQLKAELTSDITKYEKALRDYKRYKDLVRRKVVSEDQYEQKRLDMNTARDSIAVTRAKLKNAENDLNYCFIKSPLNGLCGYVYQTTGNLIEENKDRLVVINRISPIAVNFYLPQKYLGKVQKYSHNSTLEVLAISEGEDLPETGKLTFIDNMVDEETGTIWMQATFQNKNRKLWPGNYVNIRLKLYGTEAVQIPMEASCKGPEGDFVWVALKNGTVAQQPVIIERRSGKIDIISKGLSGGETIVTDGQLRLYHGASYRVHASQNDKAGNQ
ncbi:efflux RND transporter periplasmic adaptor subunit [Maridesulfovibrio bastinii]|uniref:efflux RND transporter periplasmic adaptor subunit n=1 Tax=Maridesulfovibrio bastinii TaxID=47157 RepID=UPI000684850D|nr:efflux RND transporter periplasmic adaptor subunit [Maridesulfovibrio bastinii]